MLLIVSHILKIEEIAVTTKTEIALYRQIMTSEKVFVNLETGWIHKSHES